MVCKELGGGVEGGTAGPGFVDLLPHTVGDLCHKK